jgi:hypothetical protein
MGVGSLVMAALSLLCIGLSVVTTLWAPVAAAAFSFGAPALALAGVVTGGMAMSRAKREKRSGDVGLAGAIVSGVCFVPALVTALTCGVCNALFSQGHVETHKTFNFGVQSQPQQAPDRPQPGAPNPPPFPGQPAEPAPAQPDAPPGSPQPDAPPTLPPPPLPASPRGP